MDSLVLLKYDTQKDDALGVTGNVHSQENEKDITSTLHLSPSVECETTTVNSNTNFGGWINKIQDLWFHQDDKK